MFSQIDSAHLNILNDSKIQDGHHEEWEQEYVAAVVRKEVRRLLINTVSAAETCMHGPAILAAVSWQNTRQQQWGLGVSLLFSGIEGVCMVMRLPAHVHVWHVMLEFKNVADCM